MTSPSGSVAFDRAVGYYDRTRSHTVALQEALTEALAEQLRPHQPVLEVGVGTGRMARPLAAAGIEMLGLDLSGPMLAKLVENAGGGRPFPLVRGDATRLPLVSSSVGAIVAWHALHLIPPWPDAVAEAQRVIRPGGAFVVARGGWEGLMAEVAEAFWTAAGLEGTGVVGLDDVAELDRHVGIEPEVHGPLHDRHQRSLREAVAFMEAGMPAWTWGLSDAEREAAGEQTRSWARATIGDLDERREFIRPVTWRTYRLP